ncbi:MAG: YlbF family regulator [Oscillospiraceae bacterium]|jgi:cell fate (sporulation/competence/biofilm development) regulator YlbF (YheA/YmcA/DUF963 family)|nr:YlbF family regulator [Oscillospiraceae bacterium]
MDVIELAKQLGKQLQEEEIYINFRVQQQNLETDKELQSKINEFNNQKIKLNQEMSKEDFDQELINNLNDDLRNQYEGLVQNEKMIKFNEDKQNFDGLIHKINSIINRAANGEDPFLENFEEEKGCGGSCAGCSGCYN